MQWTFYSSHMYVTPTRSLANLVATRIRKEMLAWFSQLTDASKKHVSHIQINTRTFT